MNPTTTATTGLAKHPAFRLILEATARRFRVTPASILSRTRTRDVATARFAVAYLVRNHVRTSLREIAAALERADQNWAIMAVAKARDLLEVEPSTRSAIEAADSEIREARGPLYRAA